MRPKGKFSKELERWTIQAGAIRMEIPSQATLKWAKAENFEISYYGACCAISKDFEPFAEAEDIRSRERDKRDQGPHQDLLGRRGKNHEHDAWI